MSGTHRENFNNPAEHSVKICSASVFDSVKVRIIFLRSRGDYTDRALPENTLEGMEKATISHLARTASCHIHEANGT